MPLTQHMQVVVSRTLSALHKQLLLHSQTCGKGRGVRHAEHLHRPHPVQMIESVAAGGALAELLFASTAEGFSEEEPAGFFRVEVPGCFEITVG